MGLHGGLIYQLGIVPLCYDQRFRGEGDPAVIQAFIRDRVRGHLAQVPVLLAEKASSAARQRLARAAGEDTRPWR